jgi:hypothetical protein
LFCTCIIIGHFKATAALTVECDFKRTVSYFYQIKWACIVTNVTELDDDQMKVDAVNMTGKFELGR